MTATAITSATNPDAQTLSTAPRLYNFNPRKRPDFRKCRGYHEYLARFDSDPANKGRAPIPFHVFYALRYVYSIEAMEAMAQGLQAWIVSDSLDHKVAMMSDSDLEALTAERPLS